MDKNHKKLNKFWLILGSTALLSGAIVSYASLNNNTNHITNLNINKIIRNDDSNTSTFKVTIGDLTYAQNNNNNPPFTYNSSIDFKDNNNNDFYFSIQITLNFDTTNIQKLTMELEFTDAKPTQDWYNMIWQPNESTINSDLSNKINDALNKQPFVGSYKLSGLNVTIDFADDGEISDVELGNYNISSQFTSIATQLKDAETKFNTLNNTQIGLIVVIIILIIVFGVMTFLMVRKKKKMVDDEDEKPNKKLKKKNNKKL